jgi:hypothetical protein
MCVLGWLARLDMHDIDLALYTSRQKMPTGYLRPVVAANRHRHSSLLMILSNTRVTRRLGKLVSTSSARHSRVKPSTAQNTRKRCPLAAMSLTKSTDYSWFGAVSMGRG